MEALQDLAIGDAIAVFGATDAMKLRSSLTLFGAARPQPLHAAAIARWFACERDDATVVML